MGVAYSAVIAIGKQFDEADELIDFLKDRDLLSQDDEEFIEDNGLSEWLYGNEEVSGELLDYYRGDGYYIGYSLSVRDPESFRKSFEDGMKKWDKLFPNDPPDMIKTVRVY